MVNYLHYNKTTTSHKILNIKFVLNFAIFSQNTFSLTDFTGYIQVQEVQESISKQGYSYSRSTFTFCSVSVPIPISISISFRFLAPMTATSVDTILQNHNSGNFIVSGCIKWLGEPVKPEHATQMVRKAELTDPSGTINLSVWDNYIQQIEHKQFYTVTNCKLKQYFGKHLATAANTAVTKVKEQDISNVEQSQTKQN